MNQISQEKATFFLIEFTKELINKSKTPEILRLEEMLALKKITLEKAHSQIEKSKDEEINQPILEKRKNLVPKKIPPQILKFKPASQKRPPFIPQNKVLTIPSVKFPAHLQYIQPSPTDIQIDLGKLNPLIDDPRVKTIECYGQGEQIAVLVPNKRTTNIILNEEEVNQTVINFSKAAKIPIQTGVLKIALGRLILSAIISEVIGTKFIIQKMNMPNQLNLR